MRKTVKASNTTREQLDALDAQLKGLWTSQEYAEDLVADVSMPSVFLAVDRLVALGELEITKEYEGKGPKDPNFRDYFRDLWTPRLPMAAYNKIVNLQRVAVRGIERDYGSAGLWRYLEITGGQVYNRKGNVFFPLVSRLKLFKNHPNNSYRKLLNAKGPAKLLPQVNPAASAGGATTKTTESVSPMPSHATRPTKRDRTGQVQEYRADRVSLQTFVTEATHKKLRKMAIAADCSINEMLRRLVEEVVTRADVREATRPLDEANERISRILPGAKPQPR